jgi:hypothetical protein
MISYCNTYARAGHCLRGLAGKRAMISGDSSVNVGTASADEVPMGRCREIPELTQLMLFLQADGCECLTGQTIGIAGGHHLAAPSTFAALGILTSEDWAQPNAIVRAKAEEEKKLRTPGG